MALIVGVFLGGMSRRRRARRVSDRAAGHAVGVTLLFASRSATARWRASPRAPCGSAAAMPVAAGHVLRARLRHRDDRRRRHADERAAGAAGHGRGRPRRHPAAADGDHDRQRRAGRHAVAIRADRHRRARRDGSALASAASSGRPLRTTRSRTPSSASAGSWCSAAGGFPTRRPKRADAAWSLSGGAMRATPHWLTLVGIAALDRRRGRARHARRHDGARHRRGPHPAAHRRRERRPSSAMPWGVILMVTGVTVLDRDDGGDEGHGALHERAGQRRRRRRRSSRSSRSAPASFRSTAARRASCCRHSCRWCPVSRSVSAASTRCRSPGR